MVNRELVSVTRDLPARQVSDGVVVVAQQRTGGLVRTAVVAPLGDVVRVAPRGPNGAAGPTAVMVTCDERKEQVLGHEPVLSTEVEDR